MSTEVSNVARHWARILRRWPVDILRPEPKQQFQTLLKKKIQAASIEPNAQREVNAAYLLLDDRIKVRYPLSAGIMAPESNPAHYTTLARELKELPSRTFFGSVMKRMQNIVKWR